MTALTSLQAPSAQQQPIIADGDLRRIYEALLLEDSPETLAQDFLDEQLLRAAQLPEALPQAAIF